MADAYGSLAPLWGLPVRVSPVLRQGQVINFFDKEIVVGTRPATEIQQIVMDGFAEAHPWFRDPMRVDLLAELRSSASCD